MLPTSDRAPSTGVYPRGAAGVNLLPQATTRSLFPIALLTLAPAVGGIGCALDQAGLGRATDASFVPIGVSYGVEPVRLGHGDRAADVIDADFQAMRRMELNTVFLRHVAPGDVAAIAAAARRRQLRIVLPDRAALYYVRTGEPPAGFGPAPWVVHPGKALTEELWAVDLGAAGDTDSTACLQDLAGSYLRLAPSTTVFLRKSEPIHAGYAITSTPSAGLVDTGSLPVDASTTRALMIVRCDRRPGESAAEAARRWQWQFHDALAAGLTGGLVLEQYWAVPGGGSSLTDADRSVDVERINAIRRISRRMRRWGPLLDQRYVEPFRAQHGAAETLDITLFARDERRLLLVFNRSRGQYCRTTLTLDRAIGGLPVHRLVDVPGDPGLTVGEVHPTRHGRITLSLEIAPGDARLYEVF